MNRIEAIEKLVLKFPDIRAVDTYEFIDNEDFENRKVSSETHPVEGATAGIITLKDGRIVLAKRIEKNLWTVPGGRVELGEEFDAAFVREAYEETGLVVKIKDILSLEFRTYKTHSGKSMTFWFTVFISEPNGGHPYTTDIAKSEDLEIGVFRFDSLPENMTIQDKSLITRYRKLYD